MPIFDDLEAEQERLAADQSGLQVTGPHAAAALSLVRTYAA
jgi:hypothetical protein